MPKRKNKDEIPEQADEKKVKTTPVTDDNTVSSAHFAIEHCKSWSVYKRNAARVSDILADHYPDIPILVNSTKPRSKSFELVFHPGNGGDSTTIWSGIKLGPPRKLKFVEDDKLIELLKQKMNWSDKGWNLYDKLSLNLLGDLALMAIPRK